MAKHGRIWRNIVKQGQATKLVQAAFPIQQPGDSVPLKTSYTFGMSEWGDTQHPSRRQTEPCALPRCALPRCALLRPRLE